MNYESIIMIAQWGIIGLFILFHFLVGFYRGTKKTLYYTIVSFLLTFLLLWGISFLTIRIFFTPGSLLTFIERFATVPDNLREYLVNPDLSAILFAVIDVVIKIIAFIIFYPLFKRLFTWIIFKPIWKGIFKGKEEYDITLNKSETKFIQTKKYKEHSLPSRFFGAIIGGVRGFVTAFVLLLPIIMLGGVFRSVENGGNQNLLKLRTVLSTNSGNSNNELLEIIETIQKFDKYGIGQFTKDIKIQGKSLENAVFDFAFTTQVITKDENGETVSKDLKVSEELNIIGQVARVLIEGGYLDSDYDFETITLDDNYADIDYILTKLGNSNLVNMIVPMGVDLLAKDVLPDILKFDPTALIDEDGNKLHTKQSIDALRKLNFKDEARHLSKVIEEILTLGSVKELIALSEDPELFLDYDNKDQRQIANILRSISELQILAAANIGLEYAIRNDSLLNKITWEADPLDYVQRRLSFILENEKYLIGSQGEIYNLASLIDAIFAEEFNDYDYARLIGSNGNVDSKIFLEEDTGDIIGAALLSIIDINTIMNLIPVGIDYVAYGMELDIVDSVSNQLVEDLAGIEFDEEIENINDIYQKVLTLGLGAYFEDQAEIVKVTDNILKEQSHTTAIKAIINHIFTDSEVVNTVLENISTPLVEKFITNTDYKNIALKLVDSDIKYGLEFVSIIEVVESMYSFTTMEEITKLKGANSEVYLNFASDLGAMTELDFNKFKNAITKLQTLDIVGADIAQLIKDQQNISKLIIPEDAKPGKDIGRILDLVYEVGKGLHIEGQLAASMNDINLARVIDANKLSTIFKFDETDADSILLASLVEILKQQDTKLGEYGSTKMPVELLGASYSSSLWTNEVTNLLKGIFGLTDKFSGETESFPLSLNNLKSIKGPNDIPTDVILRIDEEDLDKVLESLIVHTFIDRALQSEGLSKMAGSMVNTMFNKDVDRIDLTPDDDLLDQGGRLNKAEIKALFKSFKLLDIQGNLNIESISLNSITGLIGKNPDGAEDDLTRFLDAQYFARMLSRMLTSNTVKESLATTINIDAQDIKFTAGRYDGAEVIKHKYLTKTELYNLFVALDVLGINDFDNINVDTATLKGLTSIERTSILNSTYLYEIISLVLESQITDIPVEGLVDSGKTEGFVKKEEIELLISSLNILNITETEEIDPDTITIQMLEDLVNLESIIITRLLSNELKGMSTIEIPNGSLVTGKPDIRQDELLNIVEILTIVANDDKETIIGNINTIAGTTKTKYDRLLSLRLEDMTTPSPVVNRMLSNAIINEITDIPPSAKDGDDIKHDELEKISGALGVLNTDETDDISDGIDPNVMTIQVLEDLINLESIIITRMLSDDLKGMNTIEIPVASLVTGELDIRQDELLNIVEILAIIADNDKTQIISSVNTAAISITTAKYDELLLLKLDDATTPSPVVNRMLSNAIIDEIANIPTSAKDGDDIKHEELLQISIALHILNITEIDKIEDDLTLAKLKGIDNDDLDIIYGPNGSDIIYVFTSDLLIAEATAANITIPPSHYVDGIVINGTIKRESTKDVLGML